VLVLEDLRDLGDLETIIAKVGEALELPFSLAEGLTIQVRGSLGLTVFPLDDSDADLLLRHADQALSPAGRMAPPMVGVMAPLESVENGVSNGVKIGRFLPLSQPAFWLPLAGAGVHGNSPLPG